MAEGAAAVYNLAGDRYATYADGASGQLFALDGPHAYADRCVWDVLEALLISLRKSGRTSIRLLDAGCGPGTWLRRLVTRAHALGFEHIGALGFDIAEEQIKHARIASNEVASLPGVDLQFEVADLAGGLPSPDGSVDLTLCLYSVLSHLDVAGLSWIAHEIARVTAGHFVTTVRPVGSPPSAFIEPIEKVRHLLRDAARDRCEVELMDGRRYALNIHLFTAAELRGHFADHFHIETLRGLDLFHTRFTPDPRWNRPVSPVEVERLSVELARLEETYGRSLRFVERAAHLLLVGRRRIPTAPASVAGTSLLAG